ncbi:MAG: hypothetical protein H3C31_09130 [Brumimicrobium sp.]|nr:hypothetical protein [Brumimicrobium sp.]
MKYFILYILCILIHTTSTWSQDTIRVDKTDSITYYHIQNYQALDKYINDTFFGILDSSKYSKLNFIQFGNNHFQFYTPNSPSFERLFFELRQMVKNNDRKLNFYHIGGSHVQADIYTNDVRNYLQTYWAKLPGERNWVFPYNLAKTNNPSSYTFTSDNNWEGHRSVIRKDTTKYGLMGMAIHSNDTLIKMDFRYRKTESQPPIQHVRIYHNKGVLPYNIKLESEGISILNQIRDESLGTTDLYLSGETNTFHLEFSRIIDSTSYKTDTIRTAEDTTFVCELIPNPLYLYGFQLLNNRPGISYNTIGVNGAGLYNYLDNVYLDEQLKQSPPDLFVFSVGTNDANVTYDQFKPETYKSNLKKMMQKVLAANPNCAILLTVPNDAYYYRKYPNKNVARERTVIIELAKEYQIPVWDLYGIMGELGASKTWRLNGLMKSDYIHFTSEGYHLKGNMLIESFLKWIHQMEEYQDNSILKQN